MTTFSLWLKNELKNNVGKVSISKRLKDQPAILFGQVSSSMRMVMAMMEQQGNPGQMADINKNNTLEINPSHPIIVKLNELRKKDSKRASQVAGQLMDNVMLSSGIPFNITDSAGRNFDILNDYLNKVSTKKLDQQ